MISPHHFHPTNGVGPVDSHKAATCLGGCREAARVFGGSPTAPDPIFV